MINIEDDCVSYSSTEIIYLMSLYIYDIE